MEEQDRKIVVKLELEKADRFYSEAVEMQRQKYFDLATNRYYYACFHAVQALLISNKLSAHTHSGLITTFGLHFVKTGKVTADQGTILTRMEQLRQRADYNCIYNITEAEVIDIQNPANDLIKRIKELVVEAIGEV